MKNFRDIQSAGHTHARGPQAMLERSGFTIAYECSDEKLYAWLGGRVEGLSTWKLWDLLRKAQQPSTLAAPELIEHIIEELQVRNAYEADRPWLAPN